MQCVGRLLGGVRSAPSWASALKWGDSAASAASFGLPDVSNVASGLRGLKVGVYKGQIDKALREIQRKVLTENAMKEWRDAEVFIPPAQRRVLARKESERRFRRHHFKHMLGIVLAQRQRGF